MNRSNTIQIAIDLGTTNSSVAINNKGKVQLIKNTFGDTVTPSVFGIDKSKNLVVGKRAYEKLFRDASTTEEANYRAEVKRIMGTKDKVNFPRLEKDLNAEEISAEIIKSLKSDILRKYGDFSTLGVVVTIPAHFSTVQAEATKRAAEMAGFEYVVLLQEPIAAAISYGFGADEDHNWIVYDLGGGTFDVAAISSKDGILSCVTHCGDNYLGGKDFDWLIVDQVLVPALKKDFSLSEFDRGNPEHHWKFAKLKYFAESAKIYLTEYDKTIIEIDALGQDEDGKDISSVIEITRDQFHKLIDPLVERTIELTKQVIKDSGLDRKSIEKVVLIGGPTQIPYLRDKIHKSLNIEVNTSSDPLNAVAHGACIFAGSQSIPDEILSNHSESDTKDTVPVKLHFEPMTGDTEEPVSGVIELPSEDDYFVQIQSEDGTFSTPKIPLQKNGKFYQTVTIQPKKSNLYWIYLLDAKGKSLQLAQDSFTITHGLTVSGAPLPHSIGVGITKKQYGSETQVVEAIENFFKKDSTLPLSQTHAFKTVRSLGKGDTTNALPIKVYEGESEIPDRNQILTKLEITGKDLPFDLPEGTEVDITINVDPSRTVTVEAYIPTVDIRLNARADVHDQDLSLQSLEKDLDTQEQRIRHLSETSNDNEIAKHNTTVNQVRNALKNSETDEDEKRKASKMLRDLKTRIDLAEKDKQFPTFEKEFKELIEHFNVDLKTLTNSEQIKDFQNEFEKIKKDGNSAIQSHDKELLARVNNQLLSLWGRIVFENPDILAHKLEQLASGQYNFTDKIEADYFIKKGRRAIELGDLDELKRCVRNLLLLLPVEEQAATAAALSGITK